MKKLLLLLCAFISIGAYSQSRYFEDTIFGWSVYLDTIYIPPLEVDTVPVILLVCDTTPRYDIIERYDRSNRDTVWVTLDDTVIYVLCPTYYYDTMVYYNYNVEWEHAYEVVEKHNTSEGVMDPYYSICVDDIGNRVSCYRDYWEHVKYLNLRKKEFKPGIIIWDSKRVNK